MSAATDKKLIDGVARSVRELLANRKYGLDYYQREYTWTESNVDELLTDLTDRFLREYDKADERRAVANYRPYFLGPLVTSLVDGTGYLVDGQQRLTTLSLLIAFLIHLQGEGKDPGNLRSLVFSEQYGDRTFNINVDERNEVMQAVLNGEDFDPSDASASVRNIWERYGDIVRIFPDEVKNEALPYFIDWLLNKVVLVEIGTTDQDMALEIFESMNDRGQRLSSTDMLKGYLLARIRDDARIEVSNRLWREQVTTLSDMEKNADAEFLKTWLRGKFARTIRERKRDAAAGDFDLIGTAFHKWVRENSDLLDLESPDDYFRFINHDFKRLGERYKTLLRASAEQLKGWEHVFYNATNGLTLQFLPILAAVMPDDDEETFRHKTRMVAGYLDLFVARRMVNFRNFGYSTIVYTMFNLAKDVRDRSLDELRDVLADKVADIQETFEGVMAFSLTQRNRSHVRYLLARMASWLGEQTGDPNRFADYVDRARPKPFEVEHVWADKYARHQHEFGTIHDFRDYRNRFGGLLLLPKDFNASYGAKPYEEKMPHYHGQNLLAASLSPLTYEHNPTFRFLREQSGLEFRSYPDAFSRESLDERQALYKEICEIVWDPASIGLAGGVPTSRNDAGNRKAFYGVTLLNLLDAGLLSANEELRGNRNGKVYRVHLLASGNLRSDDGREFPTLSAAADTLTESGNNGWEFWSVSRSGANRPLTLVRSEYLASNT